MKVMAISRKQYKNLAKLDVGKEICNTEGRIYHFYTHGEHQVLKELYVKEGETFAAKLYTLEMLSMYREYFPKNFHVPERLAEVSGEIVGFTMPFIEGINLSTILKSSEFSVQEHIYYLRRIGQILEQLEQIRTYTSLKTFFLNDLHEANFIVNTKAQELEVLDLDSCKIENNPIFASKYLTSHSLLHYVDGKYHKNGDSFIPDQNTDLYCYLMIIFSYLFGRSLHSMTMEEFYTYLNYLDKIGFDKELLSVFMKILSYEKNENPEPYLETITSENVCRAKENVYKIAYHRI